MRRLSALKEVTFDFDGGGGGSVDCRVALVTGPVARLATISDLTEGMRNVLRTGSLGYLLFKHRGAPVALRGAARTTDDDCELDFVVVDGVQLVERRLAERIPLIARTRILDVAAGSQALETVTANISVSGAL